jgi:hypothetical protein
MIALPPLLLVSATVALGIFMGIQYLRGRRNKPILIGAHFLLGAGGLETMVILMRGTPDGEVAASGSYGTMAAGFLALALLSGVITPLVGRSSPASIGLLLATHASVAAAGFVLVVAWVSNL